MTTIKVEIEFDIDEIWCANSEDAEERDWFWNGVFPDCVAFLHSNDCGDTVAESQKIKILSIKHHKTQ